MCLKTTTATDSTAVAMAPTTVPAATTRVRHSTSMLVSVFTSRSSVFTSRSAAASACTRSKQGRQEGQAWAHGRLPLAAHAPSWRTQRTQSLPCKRRVAATQALPQRIQVHTHPPAGTASCRPPCPPAWPAGRTAAKHVMAGDPTAGASRRRNVTSRGAARGTGKQRGRSAARGVTLHTFISFTLFCRCERSFLMTATLTAAEEGAGMITDKGTASRSTRPGVHVTGSRGE